MATAPAIAGVQNSAYRFAWPAFKYPLLKFNRFFGFQFGIEKIAEKASKKEDAALGQIRR